MTFTVQVVVRDETNPGDEYMCCDIATLERNKLSPETLGLMLEEGKTILKQVQEVVVEKQLETYLGIAKVCPECGKPRRCKGYHEATFRTVFGKLCVKSPRWHHCSCQGQTKTTQTFSPLAQLFPERTTPELLFLETKWASLVSYGMTTKLIKDVLPVDSKLNDVTIRNHLHRMALRQEATLGEEAFTFVEGCPRDWAKLPIPDGPLVVGIDGGFVRACEKDKWFEVIAGKSYISFKRGDPNAKPSAKCFATVHTYDTKPKRRLLELLKSQGMQENQQVIFLSDGGDTVRKLQLYLNPQAEHLLDWFHISMRFTVLEQYVKGLTASDALSLESKEKVLEKLERIKHYLWHGNIHQALCLADLFAANLEAIDDLSPKGQKLGQAARELHTYLRLNGNFVPNYGERYRNGERISTGFVESAVNQVVSKRFVKKQQMRWTPRGAHLLLQTRTKVLNGDLEQMFRTHYPGFRTTTLEKAQMTA
jgi:hypothetical protein